MKICLSACESFFRYLEGACAAEEVLQTPAYQAVNRHARLLQGQTFTPYDLEQAVAGLASPFFGLKDIRERLPQIRALLKHIDNNKHEWAKIIEQELTHIVPVELVAGTTIYPIVGYDVGIGIGGIVAMNINWPAYFTAPHEFLSLAIHESFHVAYDRVHNTPDLSQLTTAEDLMNFLYMLVQNEGYAVYAPLALRQRSGWANDESSPVTKDYAVLSDRALVKEHLRIWDELHSSLCTNPPASREEYLERMFTGDRLAYRVGAYLVQCVAEAYGIDELTKGVYLSGKTFVDSNRHLLR